MQINTVMLGKISVRVRLQHGITYALIFVCSHSVDQIRLKACGGRVGALHLFDLMGGGC